MRTSFLLSFCLLFISCAEHNKKEKQLKDFIDKHIEIITPLERETNIAYWNAATTGKPEYYDKYSEIELEILKIYSNPVEFSYLKETKKSRKIKDSILSRQLEILYNLYLVNQIKPELLKSIVDLNSQIRKKFSTFRGIINGKKVTSNEIVDILKSDKNSEKRKNAWLASKQVAEVVSDDLIRLVKLRNQAGLIPLLNKRNRDLQP